ncbi:MAG: tetratricopeptide repeat protein [SAR324 cluster bacterium]|nr:tetratricopeptide repeat protein [SAR324 cluster bacterium]
MASAEARQKLTAVFVTDVVGYSRLMANDHHATVKTLAEYREVFSSYIQRFQGRVVNAPGDSILAEFESVVDAVNCAVEIQRELAVRNSGLPEQRQMHFRIGVNLGDVLIKDGELFGDGVNIAARLESLADPGGVCISRTVYDQVESRLPLRWEYLGEQAAKNIAKPVRAYRVLLDSRPKAGPPAGEPDSKAPAEEKSSGDALLGILEGKPPPLPDKPSIAVLAFENMSGDPEQEYFSDGIAEDIITDLCKLSGMFVIARNSSFSYKGRNVRVQQIGREMGVRYVLEGSVRKAGKKVRITAQLVVAATGEHLWAQRYDRELEDVFALQDEITEEVVTALDVKLVAGEQARIWRNSLKNPEARDLYYRARENLHHRTIEGSAQARQLFAQVIAAEPDSPLGYAGEAWSHWYDAFRGWSASPAQSLARAEELARNALARDESNPEAHGVLGLIHILKREYDQAVAEGERAVALGPNMADVAAMMELILRFAGRFDEALAMIRRAMRLCPVCPAYYLTVLGLTLTLLERYDEAIDSYHKAAALEPDYPTSYFGLAVAYGALGRNKEARAAAEAFRKVAPHLSSLQEYARRHPYKDPAVNERWIEALNKAGID